MKISENILNILANCELDCRTVRLPAQLDRKTYLAVNKCLGNLGGAWNRKAKGHVFDYDPAYAFDNLLLTGETRDMKKDFQYFPTPRELAEEVADIAALGGGCRVLEPSCGNGALADVIWEAGGSGIERLLGIELNADMGRYLADKPYQVMLGVDFLEYCRDSSAERGWTHIVMNPPFSRQQDIDHILAAYGILAPGGTLISILSPSPFFRNNKKSREFRGWLDEAVADIVDVVPGAFKESGTNIAAKIIKIVKPAA